MKKFINLLREIKRSKFPSISKTKKKLIIVIIFVIITSIVLFAFGLSIELIWRAIGIES